MGQPTALMDMYIHFKAGSPAPMFLWLPLNQHSRTKGPKGFTRESLKKRLLQWAAIACLIHAARGLWSLYPRLTLPGSPKLATMSKRPRNLTGIPSSLHLWESSQARAAPLDQPTMSTPSGGMSWVVIQSIAEMILPLPPKPKAPPSHFPMGPPPAPTPER